MPGMVESVGGPLVSLTVQRIFSLSVQWSPCQRRQGMSTLSVSRGKKNLGGGGCRWNEVLMSLGTEVTFRPTSNKYEDAFTYTLRCAARCCALLRSAVR